LWVDGILIYYLHKELYSRLAFKQPLTIFPMATFFQKIFFLSISINMVACKQETSNSSISKSITDSIVPKNVNNKVNADTITIGNIVKYTSSYNFELFESKVFKGKLAKPNFKNNPFAKDKRYQTFIMKGCERNGLNFGGHYTIIEKSCGAMCESIFIIDRIDGRIFTDIEPNDGKYGYLFKKDSRLLISNFNVFNNDELTYYNDFFGKPELYVWETSNFTKLK